MSTKEKTTAPTPATTTIPLQDGAIAELIKTGKALGQPQTPEGLAPYAIVPDGFTVHTLPRKSFAELPDHIRQEVRLDDAESFITYVKHFRTATTRIFATRPDLAQISQGSSGGADFTAVLDYHEGAKEQKAGRVKHIARYPVPLSLEMLIWLKFNGQPLKQMGFVEFIEANCADVVNPTSAALMEMALNFEERREVQFQSKVDRVSGGRELKFVDKVDGGQTAGSMKVPEGMDLRLAVFEGGKPYMMRARLEYRANGGALAITYHLQRPHDIFRQAHADLKAEIAAATELEILTGKAAPIAGDLT